VAQEPDPPPFPKEHASHPHAMPGDLPGGWENGPRQTPDGLWYMPEGAEPQMEGAGLAPQDTGGPDDFGYTWDDSVPLNWIDASGGTDTGIDSDTDRAGPIDIGFPFKYYENTYDRLFISRYGFLSFNDDGLWNWASRIPSPEKPNDVIAPHWVPSDDVGYVRYLRGGALPNRWFAVEWNQLVSGDDEYTFEVILHENGNIIFQYDAMNVSGGYWCQSSGIEDSTGLDGLTITKFCRTIEGNHAVKIVRPAPDARVGIRILHHGVFTHAGDTATFQFPILNTGELGADTYDITVASPWPATLYHADGTTLLSDTNGNGVVDTGSIAQGQTKNVVVEVQTPAGADVGAHNETALIVRSSLNASKQKIVSLRTAVPTNFAQVYQDSADGAMSIDYVRSDTHFRYKATVDGYWGYNVTITELPNQNSIYAWSKHRRISSDPNVYVSEIEYTILSPTGEIVRPVTRLADHSGATVSTYDYPSVAVAPNGRIGVLWSRRLWNNDTNQFNYNIHFATLDSNGDIVSAPQKITDNDAWGTWDDLNVPRMYSPHIAATDENHFVLAWQQFHYGDPNDDCSSHCGVSDIWYALRRSSGSEKKGPTKLTNDTPGWEDGYGDPSLTNMNGIYALLTFTRGADDDIYYVIIHSQGHVVKGMTNLSQDGDDSYDWRSDAVQLSDGQIIVAWSGEYPRNEGEQGWTGSYYNNETLSGDPVLVRTDDTIDFWWWDDSPDPSINRDHFSVRWEGTIAVSEGDYTFNMGSDDGSRLWVDGQLVMDYWDVCCTHWQSTVSLSDGLHQVVMEMHEHDGAAWADLTWQRAEETGYVTKFAVIKPSGNPGAAPQILPNSAAVTGNGYVSVAADASGRAVLTWMDYDYSYRRNLYYALVDGSGSVLTPATIFRTSQATVPYIFTSYQGYGNTSYSWQPDGVDASLSVSDETLHAAPGSLVELGVQYSNRGSTATGVTLVATLDPHLAYHADSSSITPAISGNTVTWHLPDLRLFEERDFTLELQVTGGEPDDLLPIHLELRSNEPDLNPDDNVMTAQVKVAKPLASGIGVLNISSWEPTTLDPALATDTPSIHMVNQLFAGLTRIDDATGQTLPDLASSWEMSPDAKTFTFTLRDGLTWSDGTSLTAEHVRYGVLRSLNPTTGSDYSYVLYIIKNAADYNSGSITDPNQVGVTAIDDTHIRFELEYPAAYFPSIASMWVARPMPEWIIDAWGDDWTDSDHIVTSGPYLLDERVEEGYILLEKNADFYNAANVHIENVNIHIVDGMNDAWDMYQAGELDTVSMPADKLSEVRLDPILSQQFHTQPWDCTYYYGFSTSQPPFDNPLVRKAFAAAMDRRGLIANVTGGLQQPALTYTPPGIFGHVDGYAEGVGHPFNPGQARQWLADAGYPNGQGLPPITLWHSVSDGQKAIAEYVIQRWQDVLGVTVERRDMSWRDYLSFIRNGEAQVWPLGWCSDYNDAYNFLHDGISDIRSGGWTNATYDNLLAQATATSDPAARKALYKQAEEILVESDAVMIPIYYYGEGVLTRPYLQRTYGRGIATYLADWRITRVSETIDTDGGSLTSYAGDITIDIPAGAMADTIELIHSPAYGMSAPAGLTGIGQVFDIVATYKDSGQPAEPEPGHSYTLSVQYADSVPAIEDTLALYFWDGDQWVLEPTSQLDPSTNTITAAPDHFSTWAVMGKGLPLYLPIFTK